MAPGPSVLRLMDFALLFLSASVLPLLETGRHSDSGLWAIRRKMTHHRLGKPSSNALVISNG